MKIYLISFLFFAILNCADNEKKPNLLLGILGIGKPQTSSNSTANPSNKPESNTAVTNLASSPSSSNNPESNAAVTNSASPQAPTNVAGSVPATNTNSVNSEIPVQLEPEELNPIYRGLSKYIAPFFDWGSVSILLKTLKGIPSYVDYEKSDAYAEFLKLIPPEGIYIGRALPVAIAPNIDCSSLLPVTGNPTYNGEHIQNVTLWKKTGVDKWEYVPGTVKCANVHFGFNHLDSVIYPVIPYWFKEGDDPEKTLAKRDLSNIKKVNELWLDPNSTYRVLVSLDIKAKNGKKLAEIPDWKYNPNQYTPSPVSPHSIDSSLFTFGTENNYYWADFKTMPAPCFKTYFDFSGYGYPYYHQFYNGSEQEAHGTVYSFTPPSVYIPIYSNQYANGYANTIQLTGPALMNKSRLELCSIIPDLCIPNINYLPNRAILNYLDNRYSPDEYDYNREDFTGQCVLNPGKETEYVNVFSRGYYFDKVALKNQCQQKKGIWRNHSYELPSYNFQQTRCSVNSGSGSGGNGNPVCRVASGRIDVTQGNWYETKKEEITNPQNRNKKISISGIHTFWENQKLIYKIKSNCKSGDYNLTILAKNIFGPLPSDFKTFKIKILNKKDGKTYDMEINASDLKYNSGRITLFIDKGDTDLEILWTNDAYKESVYDANIQIKSISLKLVNELK